MFFTVQKKEAIGVIKSFQKINNVHQQYTNKCYLGDVYSYMLVEYITIVLLYFHDNLKEWKMWIIKGSLSSCYLKTSPSV